MPKLNENNEALQVARVYDIRDCGPRNQFVANGKLVHNSGGDKMNWQNMTRGGTLRDALMAPDGQVIVVGDSSNIEARVLDKLAGQDDMVEVYRKADRKEGPDMYCVLASRIYKRPIVKHVDPQARQMGKVAKLGLGFGMGHEKFRATVRAQAKDTDGKPLVITPKFASEVVSIYREAHPQVRKLWKRGEAALKAISQGLQGVAVDYQGIVRTCKDGIVMPGGLRILFPDLKHDKNAGDYGEWTFWNGKMREHIYGAKFIENCIAEGTDILTTRGWVPIEQIQLSDLVHDGVDFVQHGGMIAKSVQECVAVDGVWMTPDHEVLTDEGWHAALEKPEPFRPDLRGDDRAAPSWERRQENALGVPVHLRQAGHQRGASGDARGQAGRHPELRLHDGRAYRRGEHDARNVQAPGICGVAIHGRPVHVADAPGVRALWGAWHHRVSALGKIIPKLLVRYGAYLCARFNPGAQEQRERVQPAQLRVGDVEGAGAQSTWQSEGGHSRTGAADRHSPLDAVLPSASRPTAHRVYDIVNAGPRQRFVVRGNSGPFIVHNCVQCLARIIVFEQCRVTAKQLKGLAKWVHSVHDEGIFLSDVFDAPYVVETLMNNMRTAPDWFPNLPLNSEGGFHQRYGKAKQ